MLQQSTHLHRPLLQRYKIGKEKEVVIAADDVEQDHFLDIKDPTLFGNAKQFEVSLAPRRRLSALTSKA